MLEKFQIYLASQKRFSEHTCLAYKTDLNQFIEFTGIASDNEYAEIESGLVRSWIVDLIDKGYSNTTVNRKLSTLRTFFKYLMKQGVISKNPVQLLVGPKNQKRLPSFAQKKELQVDKIEAFFTDDFEGIRDHLMFELFYQTGIRSSELIGLLDASVQKGRIKVLGKRNKERIIPISEDLYVLVNEYRVIRNEIADRSDNFFVLNSGKKLYPKLVYRKINNYLGKATELKKKSPHVLRHTFATHMLNNGAGLEVLKELLGHANLSATQIYTHNSFTELTNIYSQSHPRGRKK